MSKIYSKQHIEEDIKDIFEDTFNTCTSNREEIYWLISILRAFLKTGNKNTSLNIDNMQLNSWQYQIVPIINKLLKKWRL